MLNDSAISHRYGAIDIGSNAVRLQISSVYESEDGPFFKKLEYVRVPLRLGEDVFSTGFISQASAKKLQQLIEAYKTLMRLFQVEAYAACATSAMRNSENGQAVANQIAQNTGINIKLIEGEQEAELISSALHPYLPEGYCLHIDVGGGSTELNLYNQREKLAQESFLLGSVRNMQAEAMPEVWRQVEAWLTAHIPAKAKLVALGTGGNINKLYSLAGKKAPQRLGMPTLVETRNRVANMSMQDRLRILRLNPDRADVIVPASDIYIRIMQWARCTSVIVPNIGLKEGLILQLYKEFVANPQDTPY
jgi:exopolyphosphatase/guanosine-5'-triphosphate,3'-diphosphate pyrophosphatase